MKKIIDGKIYDTSTADKLAKYRNGYNRTDFNFILEELYRTKKGSYFVHGLGGAATKYQTIYGNSSGEGEDIVPLTPAEVLAWCEKTNNHEVATEHFDIEEA